MEFEEGFANLANILIRAGISPESEIYLNFIRWRDQLRTSIEDERQFIVIGPEARERRERVMRELDRLALHYARKSFLDLCTEKSHKQIVLPALENSIHTTIMAQGDIIIGHKTVGVDQHNQQVNGSQTNVAGNVEGPLASGQFQSATTLGGGQATDARGETKPDTPA